ncbi:MAG: cell division protein ZapA [Candidatus Accumulibacter sp.]|jgi:cell division protein ZapA|nr:cell division protein ZapA [Accumulibacter sp.]
MPNDANFLDITLFDKEYRIACPPEEQDALLRAVAHVDNKMREISGKTRSTNSERIAVMAALNIAHEFLSPQNPLPEESPASAQSDETRLDFGAAKRRIALMEAQLDAVLESQNTLL